METKGFRESLIIEEGPMKAFIQEKGEDLWGIEEIGKGLNR